MPTFSSATSLYEDFVNPEETVFDENAISNALHNISNTRIGSMPGRPTFGSRIYEVPFEPNDDSTKLFLITVIREAISKWEKRIVIKNISIVTSKENTLAALIDYYFKDASINARAKVTLLI